MINTYKFGDETWIDIDHGTGDEIHIPGPDIVAADAMQRARAVNPDPIQTERLAGDGIGRGRQGRRNRELKFQRGARVDNGCADSRTERLHVLDPSGGEVDVAGADSGRAGQGCGRSLL